jgi:hypothetical protein
MPVVIGLCCVAALLITSLLGAVTARSAKGTPIVYGLCLAASAVAFAAALAHLVAGGAATPIEGNIVADFPLCNKSFNCSYSGQDL